MLLIEVLSADAATWTGGASVVTRTISRRTVSLFAQWFAGMDILAHFLAVGGALVLGDQEYVQAASKSKYLQVSKPSSWILVTLAPASYGARTHILALRYSSNILQY